MTLTAIFEKKLLELSPTESLVGGEYHMATGNFWLQVEDLTAVSKYKHRIRTSFGDGPFAQLKQVVMSTSGKKIASWFRDEQQRDFIQIDSNQWGPFAGSVYRIGFGNQDMDLNWYIQNHTVDELWHNGKLLESKQFSAHERREGIGFQTYHSLVYWYPPYLKPASDMYQTTVDQKIPTLPPGYQIQYNSKNQDSYKFITPFGEHNWWKMKEPFLLQPSQELYFLGFSYPRWQVWRGGDLIQEGKTSSSTKLPDLFISPNKQVCIVRSYDGGPIEFILLNGQPLEKFDWCSKPYLVDQKTIGFMLSQRSESGNHVYWKQYRV